MWRRTKGAAPRGRARAVVAASDFRVAGEEVKELRGEVWGQCSAGTGRGNSDRSGWPPPGELAAGNRPVRLPPSGTRDFIKAGRGWMGGRVGRTCSDRPGGAQARERRSSDRHRGPQGREARIANQEKARGRLGTPVSDRHRGPTGPRTGRTANSGMVRTATRASTGRVVLVWEIPQLGDTRFRPPAAGGADRRSAFPAPAALPANRPYAVRCASRSGAGLKAPTGRTGRRSLPWPRLTQTSVPAPNPPRSRRASRTRRPTAWSPLPTPNRQAAAE